MIDLTRRNRLLNYRPTKASTVEVVDEVPQQVLRQLLEGQKFRFDPRPDSDAMAVSSSSDAEQGDLGDDRFTPGQPISYPDVQELPRRHRDDRLQTRLTDAQLGKNLLNIYRRAEESLEEQGVNTLFLALGMLTWYEADQSDVASRAPLLMLPVKLKRTSAAAPFQLSIGDEDPVPNPAIVEKLRLDFRIGMPELPDAVEDLDLDRFFQQVEGTIGNFDRWCVTSDVVLGLFSFQKFIMYRDLGRNEARLRKNPVIRAICREEEDQPGAVGLPSEILEASLDDEMSPWSTVQVVDADSSQQRAMLAVRKGHDLVIEGPPGTGKSQTITNLIADALHEGKTVLFVSEKMAALEVVKTRLESRADLGNHVLELHSNKTAKTTFVKELSAALDREVSASDQGRAELSRLRQLTEGLRKYVVELHRPEHPLNRSPYQAIGTLAQVEKAPFLEADVPGLMKADQGELKASERALEELSRALEAIGRPDSHPLRGLGIENATRTDVRKLEGALQSALDALDELGGLAKGLASELGLRVPSTFGAAQLMLEGARVLIRSPGGDPNVLASDDWNEMSAEAERLLEAGQRYAGRRPGVDRCFRSVILDQDLGDLVARYREGLDRGGWRYLLPSYWKVRKELRSFLKPDYRPANAETLLEDARNAELCRQDRREISEARALGQNLFGSRWKGPQSDWEELQRFAEWVVEFRGYALKELLVERGIGIAAEGGIDPDEMGARLDQFSQALVQAGEAIEKVVEAGSCTGDSGIGTAPEESLVALRSRLVEVGANLEDLRTFSEYVAARNVCREGILSDFVEKALAEDLKPEELVPGFRRLFYESWLIQAFEDRPVLSRFQAARHEGLISEFQRLDQTSFELARSRTHAALDRLREKLLSKDLSPQLQSLHREARKRRRIKPIRKLLLQTGRAIQHIKPCFMMSPLSVAQYLDPEALDFDLLVFDEASQIPPPDAIGAIMRAKQTVVVGDSKQLPPTNFFGVHLDDAEMDEEEELELLEDLESILDEVATAGIPGVRLKWHYRSEHQSLIRFSNEEFYQDEPLLVFPSATREQADLGLKFEHVEKGIYEGKGRNPVEARRVAQAVVEHIKERPQLSLGVGTFGIAQQALILDELDQMRREDPSIEWFFRQEGEKRFFVKNLENIQGDDRDVIFLSVTYGPDRDGRVRRNFGPINKAGGWRRLNVLTTRAKRLLVVFSSMTDDQIDPQNINPGGVLLRQYLHYARTGHYPSPKIREGDPDNPFEEAIIEALRQEGYSVVPQVGEAGYRVDIGVQDPEFPGRYVCGIECDGASYHSAATVRDRDRLRQQVLEARGWDIHRIWSTDWFHDPKRQVARIVGLIEESRTRFRERQEQRKTDGPETSPRTNGNEAGRPQPIEEPKIRDEDETRETASSPTPLRAPPYRFAPIHREGAADEFYDAPLNRIGAVVRTVLDTEGPIHVKELARRVGAFWGLKQAGSRIVGRVKEAVQVAVRAGQVAENGGFVTLNGREPVQVRSRDIEGVTFPAKEIPPSEVREAIRMVLRHSAPIPREDLIVETARLLGFQRTGPNLRKLIRGALEDLIEAGELRPAGTGLRLGE